MGGGEAGFSSVEGPTGAEIAIMSRKPLAGFALVEPLVVITIIGILGIVSEPGTVVWLVSGGLSV